MSSFEVYDNQENTVRFYFSHSSPEFTTGVMVIQPGASLPKHNRPNAVENLVQISGACLMQVFEDEQPNDVKLSVGDSLTMPKGQFHVHSNPYEEVSVTLFKAEGDITAIVQNVRDAFAKVDL